MSVHDMSKGHIANSQPAGDHVVDGSNFIAVAIICDQLTTYVKPIDVYVYLGLSADIFMMVLHIQNIQIKLLAIS